MKLLTIFFLVSCYSLSQQILFPADTTLTFWYKHEKRKANKIVDTVFLEIHPDKFISKDQIEACWIFQSKKDKKECIGMKDNGSFFLHPPREGDLVILEGAPFPAVPINPYVGLRIRSVRRVPMDTPEYGFFQGKKIKITSRILAEDSLQLQGLTYNAFFIEAKSRCNFRRYRMNFIFSPEIGVIKIEYFLPHKTKISFKLIG